MPTIAADVQMDNVTFSVLATHPVPPATAEYTRLRDEQLDELAAVSANTTRPLLRIGDLNITPWSPRCTSFIHKAGLHDSARGFGVQPTWPTSFTVMKIPIDHCLHTDNIRIIHRRTGSPVGSDHLPLIVDFSIVLSP